MQKFLNNIICGDCVEVLSRAGEPFADLIFADPPFNIGYKYDKYNDEVAASLGDVLGVPVDFQEETLVVSLDPPQYERLLSESREVEDVAKVAFNEFEPAEVPELGEQLEGLDPGCVPEEERLKFQPEDEVNTNKKLSIPGPGWGETTELSKGSKGRIENTYDANGDYYMVRLEDGMLIKISVGDLSK
jgi:hypothetical protein